MPPVTAITNVLVHALPTWHDICLNYFFRELHFQDLEREKAARAELEKTSSRDLPNIPLPDEISMHFTRLRLISLSLILLHISIFVCRLNCHSVGLLFAPFEENAPQRKLSSVSSMEESHFLQASLDLSDSASLERRMSADSNMSYYLRSMTPSAFESALRQKDGELASYMSRLVCIHILLIFLLKLFN